MTTDTKEIIANPTKGLRVESSGRIQSAALGTGHEITHAAEDDRIGTDQLKQNLERPMEMELGPEGGKITLGTSHEERRATHVENLMAYELGEATRENYNDHSGTVTTCSPTGTSPC